MPTIYDINFEKFAGQMIPPDKRFIRNVSFVKALLSPLQYLRDLWFGSYRTGATAPAYAAGTYDKYDQVLFNNSVYESLIDNNTDLPTVAGSWKLVQQNFIGLSERILYNGQKLVLEYAMNKWFGTEFRQPPLQSDIYITLNSIQEPVFIVGGASESSSTVFDGGSEEVVINSYSVGVQFNFTINCPEAVYDALDPAMVNNERIFRAFVDQYAPAGITYNIVTY